MTFSRDGIEFWDVMCSVDGNLPRFIYYAHWDANQYTITFNPGLGELNDDEKTRVVTYNEPVDNLPYPTLLGYQLVNWKCGETPFGDGDKYLFDHDVELEAEWNPITYIVQYSGGDATGTMDDESRSYDEEFQLQKANFSKSVTVNFDWNDGFNSMSTKDYQMKFIGWTTAPESSDVEYEDKGIVKNLASKEGDVVTLHALWQANSDLMPTPSREGYLFLGWSKEPQADFPHDSMNTKDEVRSLRVGEVVGQVNGDDVIANNENYMRYAPSENQTLYAMWYDNRVSLTLD